VSDILADYREWRCSLPLRIGTHDPRCHMRHDRCMTHRLADEVARLQLTPAERSAIADAADRYAEITPESAETAATLRGILERL